MKRRNFIGLSLGSVVAASSQRLRADTSLQRKVPYKNYGRRIKQAPYGNDVPRSISFYNRVSPYIANAGLLLDDGLAVAQQLGFSMILDLRDSSENGVKEEISLADELDIPYVNIPVKTRAPVWDQVDEFISIAHDTSNYPILLHCVTANRSGAMWTLYRAKMGVPPEIAIEEGRAAGLESREQAVRLQLGLG